MKDVMIDLETLGNTPETPVISIGAVCFDIKKKELGSTFYVVADVSEQLDRLRRPTASTIKWWMGQSDAAKRVFSEEAAPMAACLAAFVEWYRGVDSEPAYVWGNGATFDISIMENLFRDYGIERPWGYNKAMDLRTFKRFCRGDKYVAKSGVAHNALDDAISQAKYVLEAFK